MGRILNAIIQRKTERPTASVTIAFKGLKELMLIDFMKALVNKEYEVIIKTGQPTKEQLHAGWMDFLSSYYELKGDVQQSAIFEIQKDIWTIQSRFRLLSLIIQRLMIKRDDKYIRELQDMGYEHLELSEDSFLTDIQEVDETECRNRHDLEVLQKELEDMDLGEPDKVTDEAFYHQIENYNDAFKRERKLEELSTYDYVILCKRLYDYNLRLAQQHGTRPY